MTSRSTTESQDFGRISLLSENFRTQSFRASVELDGIDALTLMRGERKPPGSLRCRWISGPPVPAELVWTDSDARILIGPKARSLLAPFTGWTSRPVQLIGSRGEPIYNYELLVVNGRCGPVDLKRIQPTIQTAGNKAFSSYHGLCFVTEQWDDSDVFMFPERMGLVLVKDGVKFALEKTFTNVTFDKLSEVELDEVSIEVIRRHQRERVT